MRARDHEHADGADDAEVHVPQHGPHDERDDRRDDRDVEEERGGAVGDRLRAGARRLCLGDEPLDPGQRRVLADRSHAHAEGGIRRDGSRGDAVALAHRDRFRLARDHRLVELGPASDDHTVGGHAGAGTHEHDVADPELDQRDVLDSRRRRASRPRRAAARRARSARRAPDRAPSSPASGRAA